jgi:dTDP-4-dehydrorhamnose 3,5-epimerase-like enzyme
MAPNASRVTIIHYCMRITSICLLDCKRVETVDADGAKNGYLIELLKDGVKTTAYLTVTIPGAFKGYHLHQRRESNFILIKGTLRVIVVDGRQKSEFILKGSSPQRLTIPTGRYIGLQNLGEEDAWLINFPTPPYDPDDSTEQFEKTPKEIDDLVEGRLQDPGI